MKLMLNKTLHLMIVKLRWLLLGVSVYYLSLFHGADRHSRTIHEQRGISPLATE
jgi:hypothetical protein